MRIAAVVLLLVAAYFRSGPLFCVVGLLALMAGGAQVWLANATDRLRAARAMEHRLFFGETCTVTLSLANESRLPLPWLEVHESLPAALALPNVVSRVFRLAPGERHAITYRLQGRQRGLHAVGPLLVSAGDVFGLARRDLRFPDRRYLLVYPRILQAEELDLPALALFGDLRSRRLLLGDPARMAGVRSYRPGDPPHDIHWRASAATGALQVKHYQPATSVQTMIFLDLHRQDYSAPDAGTATELAISVAATVASRLVAQRQEVGLATNGRLALPPEGETGMEMRDQLLVEMHAFSVAAQATELDEPDREVLAVVPAPIAPAKGQAHLMRILELLARIAPQSSTARADTAPEDATGALPTRPQSASSLPSGHTPQWGVRRSGPAKDRGEPLSQMIMQRSLALPWGSTVVAITGTIGEDLFIGLHRLREAGLLVVLFLVEQQTDGPQLAARARALGIDLRVCPPDRVPGAAAT